MSLLCSTTLEYAGSSTSWTDGAWAFPEVPTECLKFNLKIQRWHIPEACTQVALRFYHHVPLFFFFTCLYSEADRETKNKDNNTLKWREILEMLWNIGFCDLPRHLLFPSFISFILPLCLSNVYLLCSHHLLATVYETKGEFRSALQHEKEAYSIYKSQVCFKVLEYHVCWCYVDAIWSLFYLRHFIVAHMKVGEIHDSTKESSEYLKSLTQQAVVLQKAINHIYSNTPSACIPPPKVCTVC